MTQLQIQTARLRLLPFTKGEVQLFHTLNVDPHIRKFLWDGEIITMEQATEILETNERLFRNKGFGLWKVEDKDTQHLIGYTGLWYFFEEPQPQLIYAILKPYTGKGLATEAARAIQDYAFQHLGFDYLIAATDEAHIASQWVALRLGMNFVEQRIEDGKATLFFRSTKSF